MFSNLIFAAAFGFKSNFSAAQPTLLMQLVARWYPFCNRHSLTSMTGLLRRASQMLLIG